MPGTLASDKLAAELNDGTAITSATTTTGSAVQVDYPLDCEVEAVTGTMTGAGFADIEIQACDASNFGSGVVVLGRFGQLTEADDGETKRLNVYCAKKYMRAVVVTTGTPTSYPITITVRPCNYKRTPTTTAGA